MPGMTATTRIITDQRDDVLRIPAQALRFSPSGLAAAPASGTARPTASDAGESGVWVLKDGHPVHMPLKLGLDDETYAEVRQGDLKPGDQVIIGEQSAEGSARNAPAPRRFGL